VSVASSTRSLACIESRIDPSGSGSTVVRVVNRTHAVGGAVLVLVENTKGLTGCWVKAKLVAVNK
jgi:hypothetical protein